MAKLLLFFRGADEEKVLLQHPVHQHGPKDGEVLRDVYEDRLGYQLRPVRRSRVRERSSSERGFGSSSGSPLGLRMVSLFRDIVPGLISSQHRPA